MIKKEPKVSVVMSEYNTPEAYLREAVDSVLGQTYKDFEFIIVDDSHDQILDKIVASYNDSRIHVVKNGSNKGLVYSLNNGINHARGEYIIRIDTDDIAHSDRFRKQVAFMKAHPEYDVAGTRAYQLSDGQRLGILSKSGEKGKRDIMRGDAPMHPSVIMRKDAIAKVGGYPDYRRSEDLALWCELLLAGSRIYVMDNILLDYRVDSGDYSKRTIRHRKGEIEVRLTYYPKLGAGPVEYIRVVKTVMAGLAPLWLMRFYKNKTIAKVDK